MNIEAPVETLIQTGIDAARAGDFSAARRHLTEATHLNPEAPEAWFWLGLMLDDPEEQLEYMQRVLELDPNHAHAQEAMQHLTNAISETRPDNATKPTNGATSNRAKRTTLWRVDSTPSPTSRSTSTTTSTPTPAAPPGLLQAWRAALTFDGERAYTACRGRSSAPLTAVLMIFVVALVPFASIMLPLVSELNQLDVNDGARFAGEAFTYSLCIAVQVVAALFVGAWLAAYVGRKRFDSDVSAATNFGLNGLWMVPGGLGLVALGVGLWLLGDTLGIAVALISMPFTLFVYGANLLAQLIYSNTVIHRVSIGAGVAIAAVTLLSVGLVLVWLLPLTASLPLG